MKKPIACILYSHMKMTSVQVVRIMKTLQSSHPLHPCCHLQRTIHLPLIIANKISRTASNLTHPATCNPNRIHLQNHHWQHPNISYPFKRCHTRTAWAHHHQACHFLSAPLMLNDPSKIREDCSICPYFGAHLQRHIDSKHPKSFQSEADKLVLVHKHNKLSREHHKGKNVWRFQCTYCKRGAKITRLGQHLTCTHNITDARVLSQVKANCIRLPNLNKPKTTTAGC